MHSESRRAYHSRGGPSNSVKNELPSPKNRVTAPATRARWRSLLALGPAIVVLILGATSFDSIRRARESRFLVSHTRDVIDRAQAVFSAMQDAETGERGFLITGDQAYLQPYDSAMSVLHIYSASLRTLVAANPQQLARLDTIDALVPDRLNQLAMAIAARRAVGADSAMAVVKTNHGKNTMDSIRVVIGRLISSERRLLQQRQNAEAARGRVVLWIIIAGTIAAIFLALLLNGALLRSAEAEARLAREVDLRNVQLEEQNLELELQSQQLQDQAAELEMQNEELAATSETLAQQAGELEMQAAQLEATIHALENETRAAEAARAAAEVANRAKSDFLATMSHELRTPLNAISGYTQLMQLGVPEPVPAVHHEYLARIQQSQHHLLGVINSVLNFARIEAGSVIYEFADVHIAALLDEVEPLIAPQMLARNHRYTCVPCDRALVVRADPEKVRQILLNLLSNAIKFTPPGGEITLSAEALVDDPTETFVAIRVRDTGLGIPAEKLTSIFDPFVQVDVSRNRTTEGTGLGLAISRELARGMHGDLVVDSTVGAGSTFTLTLPLVSGVPAEERPRVEAGREPSARVATTGRSTGD
jgi:signal transduction histidine kinase